MLVIEFADSSGVKLIEFLFFSLKNSLPIPPRSIEKALTSIDLISFFLWGGQGVVLTNIWFCLYLCFYI